MNDKPPIHQSDIRPLEFTIAIVVGGMGSAALSSLHVHPLVSVGFALTVMLLLAFFRWRIASEFKDFESLEAFAEDIYLLGYLLTLAALLGLAPRLMSDDTNLFNIAGLKLVTTVVGLALMMIFRQTARRWAEEEDRGSDAKFKEQQQLFAEAVARLNEGADALTNRLDDVVRRFDPRMLLRMAEWSNRAAAAFGAATKLMETFSPAVEKSTKCLTDLNTNLESVRTASQGLAGVFTTDTGRAAGILAAELSHAGQTINALGGTIATLQPASESARGALEKLAAQAGLGATQFNQISVGLDRVAAELGALDALLRSVTAVETSEVKTPIADLVKALNASADKTTTSTDHMESLGGELQTVRTATQELAQALTSNVAKPLMEHQQAIERINVQMSRTDEQVAKASNQLEVLIQAKQPGGEMLTQLLVRLAELQIELKEATTQIKAAARREQEQPPHDPKPKYFRLFGGGRS